MQEIRRFVKPFDKQEMLRELFKWSVYARCSDIAFVLLLQIESRIATALIGAHIAQRLSVLTNRLDRHHTYVQQAKDYEAYARACITACYKQNERLACQLLVRENPLYGDATCMQVGRSTFTQNSSDFNVFIQVPNREWSGQMTNKTDTSFISQVPFLISLSTIGFLSPWSMDYCQDSTHSNTLQGAVSSHD